MTDQNRTGADVIAEALAAAGCRWAFGLPGGEVLALMEALDRVGLNFVLTKHENAGGFMAEGASHATGAPGVLLATIGPGVANAVNVIANAAQDRVPLIFLTGCVDAAEAETYTHQVFDHQAMLRPIVKATFRAAPGAIAPMMEKALRVAMEGQPGPVHIDVPISVAEGPSTEAPRALVRPAPAMPAPGPDLDRARDMLAKAERPIAVVGVDAVNEGAGADIVGFCRRYGVPMIATYKAKGLLPEDHALSLGGAGLSPKADKALLPLVETADLVLAIGYDPIEMRQGWREPWSRDSQVIEIAPIPRLHSMHGATAELVGAIAPTLAALTADIEPKDLWPGGEPEAVRQRLRTEFAPEAEGWGPGVVFDTLRKAMPRDTLATADSGAHRILLSQMWECYEPRALMQSSGLCTMGCALPLAMGRALAEPGRPIVAFMGDAGLEMTLGELATLRDLKTPVILCVLVDESLALIELKQRGSQRANLGVEFGGTDWPEVAAAMGGHGVWIDDAETLATEAKAAMTRDGFTILAPRIEKRAYDGKF